MTFKEIWIAPFEGDWEYTDFPPEVEILGRKFRLANWHSRDETIQYREAVSHSSMHLRVNPATRKWRIDHLDIVNPDGPAFAAPVRHFLSDTATGKIAQSALEILAISLVGFYIVRRLDAPSRVE